MMVLMPSVAKDKAPKSEKVNNIILLIGDGMGLGVAGAWMVDRNYEPTCFDRAQFVGLSKTYSLNSRVTDSAASGTAMATGHKTNNSMLGVLPDGTRLGTIAEAAKEDGKSIGIIVTSYLLDATPAAFYAHTSSRGNLRQVEEDLIAFQPDVILGGGRCNFTDQKWEDGTMLDKAVASGIKVLETPEEYYSMTSLDAPVLGLFAEGSYPMVIDRDADYLADWNCWMTTRRASSSWLRVPTSTMPPMPTTLNSFSSRWRSSTRLSMLPWIMPTPTRVLLSSSPLTMTQAARPWFPTTRISIWETVRSASDTPQPATPELQ